MNFLNEPEITNGYENVKTVKRVDQLEINSLPVGEFSRLFIEIVENGIGRPVQVPVVVARGRKPGPIMGITAALHGNELNGIPVIHHLLQRVNLKTLCGTIVCVIAANMPGLLRAQREFTDGQDLNHIMPGIRGGKTSQVYAYNFVDRVSSCFDFLIDLHTASEGRVNSLYVRADCQQAMTAQMAYLLRPQIVVHNPPSDYTLRGTFAESGKPAITVEICDPQKFQRDPISRTVKGIRRILNHIGMIPTKQGASFNYPPPILCKKSYWLMTERGGLMRCLHKITDTVNKGQPIATQVNIFGDTIKTYTTPEDGIVIGHCVNPLGQMGERIVHLGVPMSAEESERFFNLCGITPQPKAGQ